MMNAIIRPARLDDADVIREFNRLMALETENKTLDPAILKAGVEAMLHDANKGRYFVAEIPPHPQPLSPGGERGGKQPPHPQPLSPGGERGEIVGQLGITLEWSDWRNGNFWWIQSVYVAKETRRHGVFRKLYEHVRRAAKADSSVIGIRLYVEHDNAAAQATYRKMGMAMTGYQVMEEMFGQTPP
jgi:ribosomal protein S18 acetylase RimI-like enzyme